MTLFEEWYKSERPATPAPRRPDPYLTEMSASGREREAWGLAIALRVLIVVALIVAAIGVAFAGRVGG